MRRLAAHAIPWAILLLVVGCASTPPARFYTLTGTPGPAAPPSGLAVAVGPVAVPAVVDRPQMVVTTGPNEVRLDEFHRWASPLQDAIARVVATNLVAMLGTPRVTVAASALGADANYRVALQVRRFESVPGEAATLDAVWTVSRGQDGKGQTGRTTVREPSPEPGYEALAAAHSRAIERLSRDIAEAVLMLVRSGP